MQSTIPFEDFYRNYCKIFINGHLVETPELTDYQIAFLKWLESQQNNISCVPIRTRDKTYYTIWKELTEENSH